MDWLISGSWNVLIWLIDLQVQDMIFLYDWFICMFRTWYSYLIDWFSGTGHGILIWLVDWQVQDMMFVSDWLICRYRTWYSYLIDWFAGTGHDILPQEWAGTAGGDHVPPVQAGTTWGNILANSSNINGSRLDKKSAHVTTVYCQDCKNDTVFDDLS